MPNLKYPAEGSQVLGRIIPNWKFFMVSFTLLCMPLLLSIFRRALCTMSGETATLAKNAYVSGTHSMAFVTVPNQEAGRKIAKVLVENQLAACVNMIPGVTSIYEWEGKIEEDAELLLMIKTRTSRVEELSKFVRENHPYDCAEVITSPIDQGNPPYLEWLGNIVKEKKGN